MKILNRLNIKNIITHLKKQGLEDKCQYGFVKGKSALEQLTVYVNDILKDLEKGVVDAIYPDYAKAFDKVNHMHLITKVKTKFKIAGQPLFWIAQFLTQRVQHVKINGCTSDKA